MSMPAGWYDDGSGRQRWWDGQKWTDQFAHEQGASASAPQMPQPSLNGPQATVPSSRVAPVLGFVGLGLAAAGTVLACIPATFIVGVVALIAAFVVSLVGLFKKNTAKWPSIVGMILAVVGGAIGTVVSLVIVAATLAGPSVPGTPAPTPSSSASEIPVTPQPSDDQTGDTDGRPSPEEIAVGFAALALEDGVTSYEDVPNFYSCMGQQLFDSEISDESLRLIADGQDVVSEERDVVGAVVIDAATICDPNGEGVTP